MRIDCYLKASRIIKRRSVAKQACVAGRIAIGDKVAKPSDRVSEGDIITVRIGPKASRYEVLSIREPVNKEDAVTLFKTLEDDHEDRHWV